MKPAARYGGDSGSDQALAGRAEVSAPCTTSRSRTSAAVDARQPSSQRDPSSRSRTSKRWTPGSPSS